MAWVDQETRMEAGIERESPEDRDSRQEEASPQLLWDEAVGRTPLGLGWDAEPVVLDWFGRGRPDLLVSSGGGPSGRTARIYRPLPDDHVGFPPTFDEGTEVPGLEGLHLFCPIPNGSASRFDLVALGDAGLVRLRNQGVAGRPEFGPREVLDVAADFGVPGARVVQMVAVDWDGDGLIDLLAGLDDLSGYWPEGDTLPIAQQVGLNQRGDHPGYDRSGAWRGQAPRPRVVWLRNVGSPAQPRWELPRDIDADGGRLDLAPRPAPLAIAWGGGRAVELMVADSRGQAQLYRNFGGQLPPILMEPRPLLDSDRSPLILPDDLTTLSAADLDGDRRAELLFGTATGRLFAIHSGAGRDEARSPTPILHECRTLRLGGRSVMTAADLNSDGGLDLIVGDAQGRIHWVNDVGGPGRHRYDAPVELEAGGLPFRLDPGSEGRLNGPIAPALGLACPAAVDWNDNGRIDLIVGGAGGEVLYLRNNGAPTDPRFDLPTRLRCGGGPLLTPPRVRPAAVDWDGSGQVDLIALTLQGFLCVYPRTDRADFDPPVPLTDRLGRFLRLDGGFGQAGRCALWAGPWTGSGRPDLLVGLPRGARHLVPALTGEPLGDPDDLPTVLLLENLGRNVLVPRPLRQLDGRPVVVGFEGCSPCGVDWSGDGSLDLLVGSDDGQVYHFRRSDLRW